MVAATDVCYPGVRPSPKRAYLVQLLATESAAAELRSEVEAVAGALALFRSNQERESQVEVDALTSKQEFLNGQMNAYASIMEIVIAQEAKFHQDSVRNVGQPGDRDRFYGDATVLLKTMQESFRRILAVQTGCFPWIKASVKSVYSLLLENSEIHGVACFGAAYGGLICGAAVGTVAGAVVFGAVVYGLYLAWTESPTDSTLEQARQHAKLKTLIEQFKEQYLPVNALMTMNDTFHKCFLSTVLVPEPQDICVICLEPFHGLAPSRDNEPVRAPCCEGPHFAHRECHSRWVKTSKSLKCTVCGQ